MIIDCLIVGLASCSRIVISSVNPVSSPWRLTKSFLLDFDREIKSNLPSRNGLANIAFRTSEIRKSIPKMARRTLSSRDYKIASCSLTK